MSTWQTIQNATPLIKIASNGAYLVNSDVCMYLPGGELWKHYAAQLVIWHSLLRKMMGYDNDETLQ